MRFAYIDSQGNEVTIPSVDALALRIELGAIGNDTELYDAQADRWGPAHTHEIFHTLSRDAEDDGFVAPPPPVAPPPALEEPADEPESEPEAEVEAPDEAPAAFDVAGDLGLASPDEPTEVDDAAEPAEGAFGDLGLTVADGPAADPAPDEPVAEEAGGMDFGGMDLDLAPAASSEPEPAEADGGEEEGDGSFDFGDFSGGLEVDAVEEEPETVAADAPMDMGSGMDLESPMEFAGGDGDDMGGGLDLEQPMSEYTPEDPPAWMEQDEAGGGDDDSMDFESPAVPDTAAAPESDGVDEDDDAPSERPKPRSRPSPPRRRKKVPVGMIVGGVVMIGGGVGGYVLMQGEGGGDAEEVVEVPALPAVVIPDIPAELLPQMRDMSEAALAAMLDDLRGRSEDLDIPAAPRNEWLGGEYLANASRFEDIEQFWLGIERFVDEVRRTDTELFHDKYVVEVEATAIAADTAAMLIERADSGFVAARDGRFEAYNLMDDLLNAALDLHQFLLDNESEIAWEPAVAGVSRDPVLEAVPSSAALQDEMWALVGGITDALQDLGTLDRVTRERLFAVLFDRIRRAGIQ